MKFEAIGVHPVDAPEPVHLIELRFTKLEGTPDVGDITQEQRDQPRANWQVPWDERFLHPEGASVLNPTKPERPPEIKELRLVFFFHYFDSTKPLLTLAGPVVMPNERTGQADWNSWSMRRRA